MKQLIYGAVIGMGMLAVPAYAIDPESAREMAEWHKEARMEQRLERREESRNDFEVKSKKAAESREGLVRLLGNTKECTTVYISITGSIDCRWEKLIGGCGSDHLVTRQVHAYNIDDVLDVKGGLNQVILAVRSGNHDRLLRDIVYTFSDKKTAQRAAELFQAYRQNYLLTESSKAPPSSGKAVGNKY